MTTNPGNLRVENPCPFVPTKLTKSGCNHFCKSCSKTIIDFRGKTDEEIKAAITQDTCGIFTSDQLPAQQKMSFKKKPVFYLMSFLSLLGFSVTPANAQTSDTLKVNSEKVNPGHERPLTKEEQEVMRQISINRRDLILYPPKEKRKPRFRTVGTPSF